MDYKNPLQQVNSSRLNIVVVHFNYICGGMVYKNMSITPSNKALSPPALSPFYEDIDQLL